MFKEENEEDWYSPRFKDKLFRIDQMFANDAYTYFDSEEVEDIIDHLVFSNQIDKAIWLATNALEHFPNNEEIGLRYAQVLSMNGENEKALIHLKKMEQLEPTNVDVLNAIASFYGQQEQHEIAISYFERALLYCEKGEEEENIRLELAFEYKNEAQYEKAIDVLTKSLDKASTNDLLFFELADCYDKLGNSEKAIQCYLDHIDEDPYSFVSWFNLGSLYARENNNEKAIWAFEYAVLINENFMPALFNLANIYLNIDEHAKALEQYNKCLEIDKEDPMVHYYIGECYEEMGDFEHAYAAYLKSSRIFPQLADAWLGRGIMNDLMGNHSKAIQELQVVVNLDADKYEGWLALAHVYENKNCEELAMDAYQKAFELAPEDEDVIIDYLTFQTECSVDATIDFILSDNNLNRHDLALLVLCYCHWVSGNETESMLIFEQLLENDVKLAGGIFKHFPELKGVNYFLDRLQQFDENDNE